MNTIQNIAKNVGVLTVSNITSSTLGFFLLIYIARFLGEEEFGKYSFALSFTALFLIFIDLGISQLTVREIARRKYNLNKYLANVLIIRIISSLSILTIIAIIVRLMIHNPYDRYVIFIFSVYVIINSFTLLFRSIFQAFEKMQYTSITMILEKTLLAALVLYALVKGHGLIGVGYCYIFAGLMTAVLSFVIIAVVFTKPAKAIDFALWKALVVESIPFGLNILFSTLFFKIDTIMISTFKGDAATGIYNAAYNPLLALSAIISSVAVSALFPVMSRYFISSKDSLNILLVHSSKYMAIIGFPISVGCFILADRFIDLFYAGKYTASVVPFQILALFIPVRLASIISGTLLSSINMQKFRTFSVGIIAFFNIVLNALMIPHLSYVGASIATVLSEVGLYMMFIYIIGKYCVKQKPHQYMMKPLIASIAMGGFLHYFYYINLYLLIITGAILYFILLLLLRTFTSDDKFILRSIIHRGTKHGK